MMGRPAKRVVIFRIPIQRNLVLDLREMFAIASKQYGSVELFIGQIVESAIAGHRLAKLEKIRPRLSRAQLMQIERLSATLSPSAISEKPDLDRVLVFDAVDMLRGIT